MREYVAPHTDPDTDDLAIPAFLDRRNGRSEKEIYRALAARAERKPKWVMPPPVKKSKRARRKGNGTVVVLALKKGGPATLSGIMERTGLSKNAAKSAIRRTLKEVRIERETKRTYRAVKR